MKLSYATSYSMLGILAFFVLYPPTAVSFYRASGGAVQLPGTGLFTDLDSPGSKAIAHAEGNRTATGERTANFQGHTDPGNGAHNIGDFSCQNCQSSDPAQASQEVLGRMQNAEQSIKQQAQLEGIVLDVHALANGVDLKAVQAPAAGQDYISNLKRCQNEGKSGSDAVLCARVGSFTNPATGQLEAGGFGNSVAALEHDQRRRMDAISDVIDIDEAKPNE